MMFKNLTDLPLKVLDIIPDLIAQNDDPEIKAELEKKEISFEAFEIDDVCPAPGITGGQRLKQINQAKKRANARCYAFVSIQIRTIGPNGFDISAFESTWNTMYAMHMQSAL